MPSVRVVKSSLLSDWFCFRTISVALVIATTAATREFCDFWCFESCVRTCAGSWLQMSGFTCGVLSSSMFAGLGYWSTFAWVFSSGILSFRRLFTILASSSSTALPVFSLRSRSWAMSWRALVLFDFLFPASRALVNSLTFVSRETSDSLSDLHAPVRPLRSRGPRLRG